MKPLRLGVVMDPIRSIKPAKDSTLAMLLEAQTRGWEIAYMEAGDLRLRDGSAEGSMRELRVRDDLEAWYELDEPAVRPLRELDMILMRKDPPVDVEYTMATYILEYAEADGVLVANRPTALRDANEKIFPHWFPQCCPPSLVTRSKRALMDFLDAQGAMVLKPTNGMGGRSVFLVRQGDANTNVIVEEMTRQEQRFVVAQAYLPEVETGGDKRILLVDGEPVAHGLRRLPVTGDPRCNLAAGGRAEGAELSDREQWICEQIGPSLRARGLFFVGIDVIGDHLTEVNVTSPTCIRELDRIFGINVAADLLDALVRRLPG